MKKEKINNNRIEMIIPMMIMINTGLSIVLLMVTMMMTMGSLIMTMMVMKIDS